MAPSGPTSMPGSPVSSAVTTTGGPKAARVGAARAKVSAYVHRRVVMGWTMQNGRARRDHALDHGEEGAVQKKGATLLPRSPQRAAPPITLPNEGTVRSRHQDSAPSARGAISLPVQRPAPIPPSCVKHPGWRGLGDFLPGRTVRFELCAL